MKIIKYTCFLIFLIAAFLGARYLLANTEPSKPAMTFPERLNKEGCLGLNYHRVYKDNFFNKTMKFLTGSDELTIYNVNEESFKQQMLTLKENGAAFLNPDEIRQAQKMGAFPKKCVWISFDDVDVSVYENAFPILEELQIPFTLFVISGHVGNNFNNLKLATWEQLQDMVDSGRVTVGSHTFDMHKLVGEEPIFFHSNNERFQKDLLLSKQTLEENLSVHIKDFAYPYGNGRDDLASVIMEVGFEGAYILAPRSITGDNDKYWTNRILVNDVVFETVVKPWVE